MRLHLGAAFGAGYQASDRFSVPDLLWTGAMRVFGVVSVGYERLAFDMAERTGNIWLAEFMP